MFPAPSKQALPTPPQDASGPPTQQPVSEVPDPMPHPGFAWRVRPVPGPIPVPIPEPIPDPIIAPGCLPLAKTAPEPPPQQSPPPLTCMGPPTPPTGTPPPPAKEPPTGMPPPPANAPPEAPMLPTPLPALKLAP
mmetsp:Transcript_8292/g.15680  ORF Transcript_8292/g.15680 Transcript_8292/m.15680 type:complete len:135 (+) Transcript_8292:166-570(+)